MEIVINESKSGRHTIDKYKFKVFSAGKQGDDEHTVSYAEQQLEEEPVAEGIEQEHPPSKPSFQRDELVESLLKKTDDVTSNFIKMQMKLEEMEANHKTQLEQVKQSAYQEGVEAGRQAVQNELAQAQEQGLSQFAESVKTLEQASKSFEDALGKVESELMHAALDIAKEVISMEVSEHGSEIAKKLSSHLIESLQSAASVTLKVNPADHGAISEHVGSLKNVSVISDRAINRGGVVAISDAGNIDSEVMKRYERVKQAALSE